MASLKIKPRSCEAGKNDQRPALIRPWSAVRASRQNSPIQLNVATLEPVNAQLPLAKQTSVPETRGGVSNGHASKHWRYFQQLGFPDNSAHGSANHSHVSDKLQRLSVAPQQNKPCTPGRGYVHSRVVAIDAAFATLRGAFVVDKSNPHGGAKLRTVEHKASHGHYS